MKIAAALLAALAVALAGCARMAPIYNLDSVPVVAPGGKALDPEQVRAAIIAAGAGLGWRIGDAGPWALEGTLTLREHIAVVDIRYEATRYTIRHKRSTNLNERDGVIHSNYNGWIQNLDRAIRSQISRL